MTDVMKLSTRYRVRALDDADADAVLAIYKENELFYRYTSAKPTKEQVYEDMCALPPGKEPSAKHFVGFYDADGLIAVMDLIDGYPTPETAYIGLFMMRLSMQGKHVGSAIVAEAEKHLKEAGFETVRLGINKGNCFLHFRPSA